MPQASAERGESPTRVLVTGAGGYLASFVVRELLADSRLAGASFVLTDLTDVGAPHDPRVRFAAGDLADEEFAAGLLDPASDIVIHLAGVLGGAAEADYDLARRVNVDATLRLFEWLRRPGRPARVVYASSIAVFGPPLSDPCVDDSPAHPGTPPAHHRRVHVRGRPGRGARRGGALA